MSCEKRVLLIKESDKQDTTLVEFQEADQYEVYAVTQDQAAEHMLDQPFDLVICNVNDIAIALKLLNHWKTHHAQVPFLILSESRNVGDAVEAMKCGAEDFLVKPVACEKLLQVVALLLGPGGLQKSRTPHEARLGRRRGFEKMIGSSPSMQRLFEQSHRVAQTDATVLITGESGTGKELMAEAIHRNSPRSDQPFVTINMAAVPEHLVESELFGHVKGSFTGASESRMGRFEAAHGGTLFIDEIGDFKLESQAKLLRVLENHRVTLIGSNRDREVDVRVVAATSHPLESMVQAGTFREDLYYRLNVINLSLPPLRERKDDIPFMVSFFMQQICEELEKNVPTLDAELQAYLQDSHWPGNIRQLKNCLESMLVLSRSNVLTCADLPETMAEEQTELKQLTIPVGTRLEELERTAIEQTLERYQGNRTRSAQSLGVSVRTLQRKLKAWQRNSAVEDIQDKSGKHQQEACESGAVS